MKKIWEIKKNYVMKVKMRNVVGKNSVIARIAMLIQRDTFNLPEKNAISLEAGNKIRKKLVTWKPTPEVTGLIFLI